MRLCVTCLRCYEDDVLSCSDETHEALISPRLGSCIIDGKYRLIRMLERGGMGAVYEGTHLELGRRLAIKVLVPEYVSVDPHARLRLRQEALTACKFDHPNLVRLYDFGTNAISAKEKEHIHGYDEQFIVMELLEGQSLKEMLAQAKCVALPKALAIAIQIAEGVAEIHSKGIIHRDLKPANVLICSDYKGDMVVKIVDFGAVKLRNHASINGDGPLDLTKAMFVGSPIYASPENCKGEPLDERSDIYSLGLILYEMLAGFRAFEGDFLKLLNSHAYGDPPPLINVPSSVADLVMSALRKDPNGRPQTARKFAGHLRDLELGNSPIRLNDVQSENVESAVAGSRVIYNEETVMTSRDSVTHSLCETPEADHRLQSRELTKVSIPITRAFNRFNLKRGLTVAATLLVCFFTQGHNSSRRPPVLQDNAAVAVIPAVSLTELRSPFINREFPVTKRSQVAVILSEPIIKAATFTKSKGSKDSQPVTKTPERKTKPSVTPGPRPSRGEPPKSRTRGGRSTESRQTGKGKRNMQGYRRKQSNKPSTRKDRYGRPRR